VVGVEQWAEIRRLHFVKGVSIRELSRGTGLHRNTIRRALRSDDAPRCVRRPARSKLDPFKEEIRRLLRRSRAAGRPRPRADRGLSAGPAYSPIRERPHRPFGTVRGRRSRDPGATLRCMAYDPETRPTAELLQDWAATMRALRKRDIIRTNNNPVGDIAEAIVHAHYAGERASFSQAGWDVRTPDGERIQVKAIRTTRATKRRNLSPIRDADFDSVVVVVFDEDFGVTDALKLSRDVAEELSVFWAHVNGRILHLSSRLLDDPRVKHVDLSDAYARLNA
jgi:hypothetical protein